MSEEGERFLQRWLAELANRGRGYVLVFENEEGEVATLRDPSFSVRRAVVEARRGDTDKLEAMLKSGKPFLPDEARLIASAHIKPRRGQPPVTDATRLYLARLRQIKAELRADGQRGKIYQNAIKLLRVEHKRCQEWGERVGIPVPDLDEDRLENLNSRSKNSRT